MKIALTLVVRDEEDVVDEMLRYHLERGVDVLVVTDHGSVDGTADILRRYEREGVARVLRESGELRQADWVTRMARLAADELAADWVINADADEFWWPRLGSLRETFAAVPARFGSIRALMRHFAPRPPGPEPFWQRMTVRRTGTPDVYDVFHAQVKVAHRAVAGVAVTRGNHDAYGAGLDLLREWFPLEILHFPFRSLEQMQRKVARRTGRLAFFVEALRRRIEAEGPEAAFARLRVDDEELAAGLADGSLAVDVRIRDALLRPGDPAPVDPWPPETEADAERALIADVATFMESDAATVLRRRADELDARLAGVRPRARR